MVSFNSSNSSNTFSEVKYPNNNLFLLLIISFFVSEISFCSVFKNSDNNSILPI